MLLPLTKLTHAPSLGLFHLFLHMSVLIPPKNLPDLSLSFSLNHPPPSLLAAYSKMQEESNEWRALSWKKTPGPNQIADAENHCQESIKSGIWLDILLSVSPMDEKSKNSDPQRAL